MCGSESFDFQQEYDINKIEFATSTRGYYKNVTVTIHAVQINEQAYGDEKEKKVKKKMTSNQWKQFLNALQNIPLTEIPLLTSPTAKRAFDGARGSTITITDNKGETFAHSFDNENPNTKLEPLMQMLIDIQK